MFLTACPAEAASLVPIDSLYQKSQPCVVSCLLELTVFIRSRSHGLVSVGIESLSEVAAMRGLMSVGIDSLYQKSQPCVVSCLLELTVFIRSRSHGLVSVGIESLSEVAAMRGLMSVGIESLSEVAATRGLVSVRIAALLSAAAVNGFSSPVFKCRFRVPASYAVRCKALLVNNVDVNSVHVTHEYRCFLSQLVDAGGFHTQC